MAYTVMAYTVMARTFRSNRYERQVVHREIKREVVTEVEVPRRVRKTKVVVHHRQAHEEERQNVIERVTPRIIEKVRRAPLYLWPMQSSPVSSRPVCFLIVEQVVERKKPIIQEKIIKIPKRVEVVQTKKVERVVEKEVGVVEREVVRQVAGSSGICHNYIAHVGIADGTSRRSF